MVSLLLLEQRPRAVAVDVTHCLRRKLVPSSTAKIHAGLSASWIAGDTPVGKVIVGALVTWAIYTQGQLLL